MRGSSASPKFQATSDAPRCLPLSSLQTASGLSRFASQAGCRARYEERFLRDLPTAKVAHQAWHGSVIKEPVNRLAIGLKPEPASVDPRWAVELKAPNDPGAPK